MSNIVHILRPARDEIRQGLAMLGRRYPGGLNWLDGRLDDVESGKADLWQARRAYTSLGWAIVTPKGLRQVKLSTFYILPGYRGQGIGHKLLASLIEGWRRREIEYAHVTVNEQALGTCRFFEERGFTRVTGARRAYGDRWDRVYMLSLDQGDNYWPSCPTNGVSEVRSRFMVSSAS